MKTKTKSSKLSSATKTQRRYIPPLAVISRAKTWCGRRAGVDWTGVDDLPKLVAALQDAGLTREEAFGLIIELVTGASPD